jgi:hypothetical protein
MTRILLFLSLIAVAPRPVVAQVTYLYEGNNYDTIVDVTPPFGSFTTAMRVTAEATFAAPLAPNLVDEAFDPTAPGSTTSLFMDNGRTHLDTDSCSGCTVRLIVSTDSSGNLTDWDVWLAAFAVFGETGGGVSVRTRRGSFETPPDQDFGVDLILVSGGQENVDIGSIDNSPGTWTLVPEPSATLSTLVGAGFSALMARSKRVAA